MITARYFFTATLLPNGKVLVAGGEDIYDHGDVAAAELYDPTTGTFSATGSMVTGRALHTATLLPNGKVLVAGGSNSGGAVAGEELYDPTTGTFNATGSMITGRSYYVATLLPNGKVLVAGGYYANSNLILASAELYDPTTGGFSATGSMNATRYNHRATLLSNGKVLVAGGYGPGTLATAELYDPAAGTFSATGSMITGRSAHTATLLPNGNVLVAGGVGTSGVLASAELYTDNNTPPGTDIPVQPVDPGTGTSPVSLTFFTVTQGGTTSLTISGVGQPPPSGFKLGNPPKYFELTTTAVFSGPISICINYSGISFHNPSQLAIWHYDATSATWTKLATTVNTATTTVCASTSSLSPFAIFEPAYAAQIQQPINSDGSSVFSVKRGVIPVKFTITYGGDATCQLPPATISLTRMAGTVLGSIDESEYLLASDSGSNFRIDTTNCQYIYNLATSSLGTGTYVASISIDGSVVGNAAFGLK